MQLCRDHKITWKECQPISSVPEAQLTLAPCPPGRERSILRLFNLPKKRILPLLFTRFDGGRSESDHPRVSGEPLSAVSVRAIIKDYARTAGLIDPETGKAIVKPHDLRRYVGTNVAKRFGPKQAQLVLEHKSIKTTLDHYVLEEPEMGITNNLF